MRTVVYAADRPESCMKCFFSNKKGGCRLGPNNCYYIVKILKEEKDICDGCPYGRNRTCVGWCTRELLGQLRKKEE